MTRYGLTPPPSARLNTYKDTYEGRQAFRDFAAYSVDVDQLLPVLAGWYDFTTVTADDIPDWIRTRVLDHPVHAHLFEFFGDMWMMTEQYGRHDAPYVEAEGLAR